MAVEGEQQIGKVTTVELPRQFGLVATVLVAAVWLAPSLLVALMIMRLNVTCGG
jgi:hypothetical protein